MQNYIQSEAKRVEMGWVGLGWDGSSWVGCRLPE